MNRKNVLYIAAGIFINMAACFGVALAADAPDIKNLVVKDVFEPGIGPVVGMTQEVSGAVVIVHGDQKVGYRAVRGLGLFEDDTILTGKNGNAAFKLKDGSFITLSSNTQININKSLFKPKQKTRSSFMNMIKGKARFVVKKFVDARHSEFKVKTKTSVAGVRGSDFIINATETLTEITTLEKTELEVISLADPGALPLILNDFEKTMVQLGMSPEEAQEVESEEIDRLMKEFKFLPSDAAFDEQSFALSSAPVKPEKINVDKADLVIPEYEDIHEKADLGNALQGIFRSKTILMDEHDIEERNIRIYEDKNEDIQNRPLPDFPGAPE